MTEQLVWYLLDSDSVQEKRIHSLLLPSATAIHEFRKAVKEAHLLSCSASQLRISVDGEETNLGEDCLVTGLGFSAENALVVTVPKTATNSFLTLVLGENQDDKITMLILFPSAVFAAFILLTYSVHWKSILTSILAMDIFAGLLSNLQEKTNQAWKKQPRSHLIAFVVVHLTVYPLLVVLFQVSLPLMMFLLAMLFSKTMFFALGTGLF
jgi:nitrate reductase NapE component